MIAGHVAVLVPPSGDSFHMIGLDKDWVDVEQPYHLTCTVNPIKPQASVYWSINGQPQEATVTDTSQHSNGTFRLVGELRSYKFPKTAGDVSVACLVTELNQPGAVIYTQPYKDVTVACKGKVLLLMIIDKTYRNNN